MEKSESNQELSENGKESLKDNTEEEMLILESKHAEKNGENSKKSMQLSVEKKTRTAAKQTPKVKHTVPQPFSLLSERRTSKERKSILEQSNPKLSKSLSLRTEPQRSLRTIKTQTSLRLEKITELRQGSTRSGSTLQKVIRTQTSGKVEKSVEAKHSVAKSVESVNKKKDEEKEKEPEAKKSLLASKPKPMNLVKGKVPEKKEIETKKLNLHSKSKNNAEELEIKLKKSSTFKASPLPSFYSKRIASPKAKQPEKEEEKEKNKLQKSATFKAAPSPKLYQKKSNTCQNPDLAVKDPMQSKTPTPTLRSKSLSCSESKKMDMTMKTALRNTRESTRETMKKLFKGPWKASSTAKQTAETKNSENGEVSSNEGNNVEVDA